MSDDNLDASAPVVPEPKRRGRPTKHGKAMSNNERQKKRQALTNGVFNAVVQISSKIQSSFGHAERFDRDNFTFDYSGRYDINVNNIISLLPDDLQEEFKSRVRANIAKSYFSRDLMVYEKAISEKKSLHYFGRFENIYIWEIVHGAMHTLYKYDNPTKRAIEAIPFILYFNSSHEQKYIDAYIKYRLIYGNYSNRISLLSLEKKEKNKEYSQSEKAHITRMTNMRRDIIDFEKSNRKKTITYGNELDNDIFVEQILHDVMILNDDDLKIRHKEIKRTDEIVINENTVAPIVENVVADVSKHDFNSYSDEMISAIKVLFDINDIKVDKSEPKPTEFSEDDAGLILLSTFDMYFIQNANVSQDFKRKAMNFWQIIENIKIKISIIRPKNQTDYALRVRRYLRNKSINDIHEINKTVSVIPSNSTKLTKDDLKEFNRWYINYVNNKNIKESKRDALGELIIIPDFDD